MSPALRALQVDGHRSGAEDGLPQVPNGPPGGRRVAGGRRCAGAAGAPQPCALGCMSEAVAVQDVSSQQGSSWAALASPIGQ